MLFSLLKLRDRVFYGWIIVADLLIIFTIMIGVRHSFGIFLKSIESDFAFTRTATSGVFSAHMVLSAAFAFLGGWALDRYGPRIVLLLMGLFTGLSLVLTSQASHSWQLLIAYSLLLAIGVGAGFVVSMATASRWFVKKRGFALGITLSGEGLGTLIIAPIAAYLVSDIGWRMSYMMMGLGAGLVICALSLLLVKDPGKMGVLPDGVKVTSREIPSPDKTADAQLAGFSLAGAAKTKSFWFFAGILLSFSLCLYLVITHIVAHADDLGYSGIEAAVILALIGGINVPGKLLMGHASDKIGRKKLAIACSLLQVAAMLWLAWSSELWMFYLFAVVYGFTGGGIITLIWALIGDTFGMGSLGAITGALVAFFAIGASIGPLVGGLVFDISGGYYFAFLVGAGSMLMVTIFVALTRRETNIATPFQV